MEPSKADGGIGDEQSGSTSNIPRDRQESFHQKIGTDFVDNVQLQCRSIMERMRVIKQSVDGISEDDDSLDSTDQNPDHDITHKSKPDERAAEKFSEMDPQKQGQQIKERVERIVKLVQSTAQKAKFANVVPETLEKPLNQSTVDTKHALCQNTSPVVEEKTLQCNDKNTELADTDYCETLTKHTVKHVVLKVDEGHDALKKMPDSTQRDRVSTKSAKEGEELVGVKALVIENGSDCRPLMKRSSEEKKLLGQEPMAKRLTDEQIANGRLDGRRESVAETAAVVLAHSNHVDLKQLLSVGNSVRGFVKTKPGVTVQSTKVDDSYRQMANNVVQDVFTRIGCYENFVRRASWANEPGSGPSLGNNSVAHSFTDPWEKMTTSTQNSSELAIPEEPKTDGIASTAQAQKTGETKTEETEAAPSICSTDQPKTASLVTSSEVRSQRRISLKRGQKRWAGLKKRNKAFPARKTKDKSNAVKKKLTWQISIGESTDHREVGSKASYQPEEERYHTVDEDKLAPLKEFIVLGGAKTKDGEDVVLVNPSKIPSKREFTGRREYNELMECLFLYVQKFTEEQVKTDKFVVTVHAVTQRRSRLRSLKWATEFYKLLKNRYQNRMTRCVFYKPSFKLRALVILSHPFFPNYMKEKIFIVKSHRDFAKVQGLPEGAA